MQGSLKNNLSSGLSIPSENIKLLLKTFFLSEFIENLPMKLGTVITPMVSFIPVLNKKKIILIKSNSKISNIYIYIY